MSAYMERTAAELAQMLHLLGGVPHSSGSLSMVLEATGPYRHIDPTLNETYRVLGDAAYRHQRYGTDEDWAACVAAGAAFAAGLERLGDLVIARCKRPSGHGTCGIPLGPDGECRSSLGHTD